MKLFTCLALAAIAMASANAAATKDECDFACPDVENPVCGSDGKTYSNKCYLSLASCKSDGDVTKASDGECANSVPQTSSASGSSSDSGSDDPSFESSDCNFACPAVMMPVTDENGKTYSNRCAMNAAKCEEKKKKREGSDATKKPTLRQESGSSKSAASSSGWTVEDVRNCNYGCTDVYNPVTGEDGKEYTNDCYMGLAKCKKDKSENKGGYTIDV